VRAKEGGYGRVSLPVCHCITDTLLIIDEKLAANKRRASRAGNTRAQSKKAKASHAHSDPKTVSYEFASA
jgi:hypothetical protein